ncbi:hypothetical protein J4439_04275 [Candidatus Woesearchaeota archaeon]|nr:hypothetical protein [Candidatus Woesearchaeota archaeon]
MADYEDIARQFHHQPQGSPEPEAAEPQPGTLAALCMDFMDSSDEVRGEQLDRLANARYTAGELEEFLSEDLIHLASQESPAGVRLLADRFVTRAVASLCARSRDVSLDAEGIGCDARIHLDELRPYALRVWGHIGMETGRTHGKPSLLLLPAGKANDAAKEVYLHYGAVSYDL